VTKTMHWCNQPPRSSWPRWLVIWWLVDKSWPGQLNLPFLCGR